MNKIYIITLLLLFIIPLNFCKGNEIEIPQTILDDEFNATLTLKEKFKGNFTNSGLDEFLCVYYRKKRENSELEELLFNKMIVYAIKDKRIIKQYPINIRSFSYDGVHLQVIKNVEKNFGKWNGYFYSYDLNQNGTNEIIVFKVTGMSFTFDIYEFKIDKFVSILSDSTIPQILTKLDVDVPNKTITAYQGNNYYVFKWDNAKGIYNILKTHKEPCKKGVWGVSAGGC